MATTAILEITDTNFDQEVLKSEQPVLIDFWAAWCGPCKAIAPYLDQIAGEMEGQATVAKVNVDENGDLSARFGVRSIPTLLVFKDGRVVDQTVGALPKEMIKSFVARHV